MVPVAAGRFDLDDYIDYLIEMIRHIGPGTHVVGVCQPSVPVLAAVALMEAAKDPLAPASMVRSTRAKTRRPSTTWRRTSPWNGSATT